LDYLLLVVVSDVGVSAIFTVNWLLNYYTPTNHL